MKYNLNLQNQIVIENATQRTISIIGGKGTGKTTTLKLLLENYKQVKNTNKNFQGMFVLDPLNVIRSKRIEGFRFIINYTFTPKDIDILAKKINILLQQRVNIVLSFKKRIQKEIVDFLDVFMPSLKLRNSLIELDEIHEFCPQEGGAYSNEVERYIRHCRNDNVGVIMTSQRPAKVSKNVLALTDYLILYRLTWPHDLKAVKEVIGGHFEDTKSTNEFISSISKKGFLEGAIIDFNVLSY